MATTDEDLQKKQQHVENLRQKVADARTTQETKERGLANEITGAELDAEAARLEAELVEAKRISKLDGGDDQVKSVATPPAAATGK